MDDWQQLYQRVLKTEADLLEQSREFSRIQSNAAYVLTEIAGSLQKARDLKRDLLIVKPDGVLVPVLQ